MSTTIKFVSNEGAGHIGDKVVRDGITLADFIRENVTNPGNFCIRHNRVEVDTNTMQVASSDLTGNNTLREGDRVTVTARAGTTDPRNTVILPGDQVSVTPKKVAGAARRLFGAIFG